MPRLALLAATSLLTISTLSAPATQALTAPSGGYVPLPASQRLVDTRVGEHTADGAFAGIGKRRAGSTLAIDVAGRVGIGSEPGTVLLNMTVTRPTARGFLTVWPCDEPMPVASNLNYTTDQTVAVAAMSRVAPDGTICVYSLAATHLIVDVAGEFPTGTFDPLPRPERLADTREGEDTIDGKFAGDGLLRADSTYRVRVAGRGNVPADATGVALNVTATKVDRNGYLTVFPCDSDRPVASNVNYSPGFTTPNLVFSRLDPDGDICVYTFGGVDLIVDIAGSFPAGTFDPLPQSRRLLDTRTGESTFDGEQRGGGLQQDGATMQLPIAGRAGVPADATAVVLNVTSTKSTGRGFVTTHPQGSSLPTASHLNFGGGRTVANLVVAPLGPTGDACLFTKGTSHLIVDVAGWLTSPVVATDERSCPGRSAPETAETYRQALVRRPALQRTVGHDRIAVSICQIPADSTQFDGKRQHTATDHDFAQFANTEVAPYFDEVSGGSYTVQFVANGSFAVGPDDDADDCIREALDRTGDDFTNSFVADSTVVGGGFASPGTIFASDNGPDYTVFDRPAAESDRGGWVGGAVISERPNVATLVHEIGHTVHWPHSYIGPDDEYDNPVDVMSDGFGRCTVGNLLYDCDPANTIAFNRFAAGWLQNGQVISHPTGTANYVLDRANGSGLQVIAAPDPTNPRSVMTIEARPAVGHDDMIETEGVALHLIDQANRSGGLSGLSTDRVARQARGAGGSYDHVLTVGETAELHGLTISVLRRVGDRFEVRVAGTYKPPADSFFTRSTTVSLHRSTAPSSPVGLHR